MRSLLAGLALLVSSGLAVAQVTYVDVQLGGSTIELTTGSNTSWGSAQNNGSDNLWARRTTGPGVPASGGDAWQATHGEDAPMLLTVVSGLTPGQRYTAYVYFVGKVCSHWPIAAGFGPARLYDLDDRDGVAVDASGNPNTAPSCQDWRFRVFVGHTTANATGEVAVFVDDYTRSTVPNQSSDRAVFDGIGVEPVLRGGRLHFGAGCAGSSGVAPSLRAAGVPTLGNPAFTIDLAGGPASGSALLLIGGSLASQPLGSCTLEIPLPADAVPVPLSAAGTGALSIGIPNDPAFAGVPIFSQAVTLDPGGSLLGLGGLTGTLEIYLGS